MVEWWHLKFLCLGWIGSFSFGSNCAIPGNVPKSGMTDLVYIICGIWLVFWKCRNWFECKVVRIRGDGSNSGLHKLEIKHRKVECRNLSSLFEWWNELLNSTKWFECGNFAKCVECWNLSSFLNDGMNGWIRQSGSNVVILQNVLNSTKWFECGNFAKCIECWISAYWFIWWKRLIGSNVEFG